MQRVEVDLPDDLYEQMNIRGLSATDLLQAAVRAEIERQTARDESEAYLKELIAEVGELNEDELAEAEAIVQRIRTQMLGQVS